MYIFLILFFISLLAIIAMIGRKLVLLHKGDIEIAEKNAFEVPHLEKVKHFTVQSMRKLGHAALVTTLRFYIRSMNFLKDKYEKIKTRIKNKSRINSITGERKEISKFLKIIGEYKQKIREIKHRIRKEEDL